MVRVLVGKGIMAVLHAGFAGATIHYLTKTTFQLYNQCCPVDWQVEAEMVKKVSRQLAAVCAVVLTVGRIYYVKDLREDSDDQLLAALKRVLPRLQSN